MQTLITKYCKSEKNALTFELQQIIVQLGEGVLPFSRVV